MCKNLYSLHFEYLSYSCNTFGGVIITLICSLLPRYIMQDRSIRQKKEEDDTDMHLARKIMQNKKFTTYGQADDEYDFEVGPSKKAGKKGGDNEHKVTQKNTRLLTQKERCLFCFENPKVPKHLIVSIANFTYLMLPHSQPVVPGHCCILPLQVRLT